MRSPTVHWKADFPQCAPFTVRSTMNLAVLPRNMPSNRSYNKHKEYGSWAVQVFDEESGRYYWLDVSYDQEYKEINVDWNQYIFYNTDEDDMARKAFQENCDNFDEADSLVYWTLISECEVKETNVDRGGLEIDVQEWKAKSWELKNK